MGKYYTHKNLVMVLMGLSIIIMFNLLIARYRIAIDFESIRCIPEYAIYIVDKHDKVPKRNQLYLFKSKNLQPIYPKNTMMLKYLRGLPGDVVTIDQHDDIYIDNHYWFLGTSIHSFDSRYWGSVKQSNILGRAYALL